MKLGASPFGQITIGLLLALGGTFAFAAEGPLDPKSSLDTVAIEVNASALVRVIPSTLYGANLTAWDWDGQTGQNQRFNNLMRATGRTDMRWPGGSWGDAFLWSDMEGPGGRNGWIVSYQETQNLLSKIQGRLQPIVNFPGYWYDIDHSHAEAVAAAVAWVKDQKTRQHTAVYWEIGNEIMGPWEAGWQAGIISGTYYGEHFADFYLAMKEVNPLIKIGAVADPVDGPDWWNPGLWTRDMLAAASQKGVIPDFLIIHAYPASNRHSDYNPLLLSNDLDQIAIYTEDLNQIIGDVLGDGHARKIPFWMTEYRAGGIGYSKDDSKRNEAAEIYPRSELFSGALFLAQYIMEMALHGWEGSNPFGDFYYARRGNLPAWYPYLGDYAVFPDWYTLPFLSRRFGREMVQADSSSSLVRTYAGRAEDGTLTIFVANNSPDQTFEATFSVAGIVPAETGERWLIQAAGRTVTGASAPLQDLNDLSINGVVHPNPLTLDDLPGTPFDGGSNFMLELPPSSMSFIHLAAAAPADNDLTPPSPSGAEWKRPPHANGSDSIAMEAVIANDASSVQYYFACTGGGGHDSGWQAEPRYVDRKLRAGVIYSYTVTTRDLAPNRNQSPASAPASASPARPTLPIEVENGSFELPGTSPQPAWTAVPGWSSDGIPTDSVVDQSFPTNGSWNARLKGLDASVWNLTQYRVEARDIIELTFTARDYWNGSTRLRASLFFESEGVRAPIVTREFTLVRETRQYRVSFAAADFPEAAGHRLGIEFANLREGLSAVDQVQLARVAAHQILFPHFASGLNQLSSQLILVNQDRTDSAQIDLTFHDDRGDPLSVLLNGELVAGSISATLPAGGIRIFKSSQASGLLTGSVTTYSDSPVAGVLLFGGKVGLAGVAGMENTFQRFLAPVETSASSKVNTGVAFMNPAEDPTSIVLQLCDLEGVALASSELTLPALGHTALFVTEVDWDEPIDLSTFSGLLKISADNPIAATVLRTSTGELSTFPVVPVPSNLEVAPRAAQLKGQDATQSVQEVFGLDFAHFGAQAGLLFSRAILFNLNTSEPASFMMNFKDDNGSASQLHANGVATHGSVSGTLAPTGMALLQLDSADGGLATGSASVTADNPLGGLILFSGSAGVAGVGSSARVNGPFVGPVLQDQASGIRTGIAIVNLEPGEQRFTVELLDAAGALVTSTSLVVPGNGHRALFVDEVAFNPEIPVKTFTGVLRLVPGGNAAAMMLLSQRGQLATLPVTALP